VALDDLEEERRAVLERAGEDLEEVALLVAVGLDPERLERRHRHADVAEAQDDGKGTDCAASTAEAMSARAG
jgi:hypothetical protein